ncbi:hypothetical protein QBA57_41385 [Streptomyces scabiei]|uniref:hypothetical protein n=1 Tax=Streptomyces scabiei TaxID=1930 RepID=UPI00076589E6|nr:MULTISPECIES: hypothetical protein [Streptomyces]MBP5873271.1 hypothetical protein [Streptomyces sp. LBUM 1477]MBP5880954.1 hypothetical protein [Streptomyces sp. LBUM 1487]MBP5896709.1 hypothetical protein [Streptomyces sp. LBUM 1488]MDW8470323.1 hypothetical protein [Streptomyces scabiei]MDX2533102.1 hypothetical protein [Streptomyces scabiei]
MPSSSADHTGEDATASSPGIRAGVPLLEPPGWAVAQRALFDLLDHAWRRFARDFTGPDGRLNYTGGLTTRDGVDDFYEVFFNWPQLYLLGGADDLLPASEKHWEGVTRQLTEMDMVRDEYERGYDWFHQGESLLLLYFLCMAAPDRWSERALRFADLYVDPAKGNYDPEHHVITRPHNGSDPDRRGLFDGDVYPWLAKEAETYGYPLDWLPEAQDGPYPLSADPRLGAQMRDRMGVGDTAVNLAAAGLVLNAWILSGEDRYRDWIVAYVGAWRERTRANDGLIPDNAGPDGNVGSLLEGRWYGGHYGWSWPHGWHSVGHAACVAALAAATVTGDDDYLSMVATSLDTLIGHAKVMPHTEADSSLPSKWAVELGPDIHTPTPHLPFRHNDSGWFDYNPLTPPVPVALWHHTASVADRSRLERLREADAIDWRTVRPFRAKEESGHEKAWFAFLGGDDPGYPERILAAAQAQVRHRLRRVDRYRDLDVPEADIHVWQLCNPVATEALVQLTWGGPQVLYNGGLQQARLRYHDADARRPGLPPEVAALVTSIDPEATTVELVNLSPGTDRTVIVQAGAFAEHAITAVRYTTCEDDGWIGDMYDYGHTEPVVGEAEQSCDSSFLTVELPASTRIRLTLRLRLRARTPRYGTPFDTQGHTSDPDTEGETS